MLEGARATIEAFALANLCMANTWYHILDANPARYYALYRPASRSRIAAALANLVCLAGAIAALLGAIADARPWAGVALLAIAVVTLVQLLVLYRTIFDHVRGVRRALRFVFGTPTRRRVVGAVALLLLALLGRWVLMQPLQAAVIHVAKVLAYAAMPLVPWTVTRAFRYAINGHPVERMLDARSRSGLTSEPLIHAPRISMSTKSVHSPSGAERARVVWVIFDELDYGLAFDRRPPQLSLPNFDALVSGSLSCKNAIPPAHCTELSIPALMSGLRVAGTWPKSPFELQIAIKPEKEEAPDPEDSRLQRVLWSQQESVFSRAREMGARSAAVGWYHPYARILGGHLDWCEWYDDPEAPFAVRSSFAGAFVDHLRGLVESGRYSPFGQSLTVRKAVDQHTAIRARAASVVACEDYDLVLIHWPIPHAPFFYNAERRDNSAANRGPSGYLDNLLLADKMLGELVQAVASSSAGRRSSLIVTSDHWWRASATFDGKVDKRVPFIVRLPTTRRRAHWSLAFETRRTGDLILAILQGHVHNDAGLVEWMRSASEGGQRVVESA